MWEPLSAQMMELRFTAAAKVAGVESRVTAHSGRVGLASELTSRGASIFPETIRLVEPRPRTAIDNCPYRALSGMIQQHA